MRLLNMKILSKYMTKLEYKLINLYNKLNNIQKTGLIFEDIKPICKSIVI